SIVPIGQVDETDNAIGKVVLICGSELAVSKISLLDEEFVLSVKELGEIKVPIDSVRALRFGKLRRGSRFQKALLDWDETREQDTIFISGGAELQEVEGLIEEFDSETLIFDRDDKLQMIPVNRAYGVVLASPLLKERERPSCVLSIKGGSRIRADIIKYINNEVSLSLIENIELSVSWERIKRITLRSPRLAYLSDLEPVDYKVSPIVALKRNYQKDRTITGLPIKINDQEYDKGLGFASGMQLDFLNEGLYDLFVAEIGIDDDALGYGDCEFVVMDRDEVLFRARVKGGEAAKLIKVDITGRSRVSLRVDPGKDLDIADHADWADACFLQRLK
ncbi:MAG: NPCBM/NEW2 domain-containing protein, partial [Verrucomicrobiales bacterium]